ncbi:MAG TPA: M48 family metallopeptidase, partial [Saprospiraceae bacterium]|nr:M48 family metallopeptidase [Saprospiraceae bacterium]
MRKLILLLFVKIAIVLFLIASLQSCATNPVTGKSEFMLMSKNQEIALGQQSDPSIVASFGVYNNDEIQNFINEKGQEMAKVSHRPELKYEFKVLDSPVVNAFALPGGYVYFTRGILAHFNNEAEFAGVLGHEIGHITARHSAKQYSRQVLAQVGLVAGMVLSEDFRQYADVAQTGLGLLFLKYGRDAESQSDRLGVEYSTKIGYDAREMAEFFNTLKRLSDQSGGGIP